MTQMTGGCLCGRVRYCAKFTAVLRSEEEFDKSFGASAKSYEVK
jgi:hypothetical protein